MPPADPIKVDVWSDIACPWCYIGKRRLEAGVSAFRESAGSPPVVVEYHSFELAPDTPVDFDGSEIDFLVRHKHVPEEQVRGMLDHVAALARSVGLDYRFDRLRHTNTVKAHQLLHYAKAHGRQLAMNERLLRAYFTDGRHVGRDEDLADLAAEVGLDRSDVLRSLRAGEHLAAVRADQDAAIGYGIRGVPFFVIDGRFAVSGAQPAETFTQVLTDVAAHVDGR
jgi:predicted DsbA family dithiol-disulfide isomerase